MASADYSVKTKVTADVSNFEKGMNKAEKSLKGFSDKLANSIDRLGKKGLVGSIANVTLAMQGLTKSFGTVIKFAKDVGKAINECTEAYKGQVIAERALDTAIQNNPFISGASSKALKQFASEMQKVTNYGDEELIPMMTNLVSLGRTESEVMQIMSVAMDMSAGMGISLDSAITQLNATLNGNIGRLGQQNRELKDLTEEELKQGKAIEILGKKFKGLSSATADTSKQLQNIKGDFKEALGQFTLPSSDMWNKFWAGFYEKGIEVIKQLNEFLDVNIIGKKMLSNFETYAKSLSSEKDKGENIQSYLWTISDDELNAMNKYLEKQKKLNETQKLIYERTQKEVERRKYLAELVAEENALEAENAKEKSEQETEEKKIVNLKQAHLEKIAEQEAKWENIKKVTGEEVKLEEKLKFYQDDLVAIMTEAGGQITTNNQYYKDQMAIIDKIREELGLIVDDVEEITVETEIVTNNLFDDIVKGIKEVTEQISESAKDWSGVVQTFYDSFQNAFSQTFTMLGENLVGAGNSYEDFAAVALESLSQVLSSLGAQLAAIAAVKAMAYSYGEAVAAAAASAAAFTASGIASGTAKALTKTKDKIDSIVYTLKDFNSTAAVTIQKVKELKENLNSLTTGSQYTPSSYFTEYNTAKKIQEGYVESIKALEKQIEETWNSMSGFEREKWDWLNYGNAKIYKELKNQLEEAKKGLVDINNYLTDVLSNVLNNIKAQGDAINDEINSYKTLYNSYDKVMEYYKKIQEIQNEYGKTSTDFVETLQNIALMTTKLISTTLEYSDFLTQYKIILQEQKNNILSTINSIVQSLAKSGANIGEAIIASLIDGGTKKDFLTSMKDYIRENLLKLAVYTESFQDRLAEVGTKLTAALLGGGSVKDIRKELEDLWDTASKQAEQAEAIIAEAFGDIQEVVEEAADGVEESLDKIEEKLSSFTEAMNRFKEDVSDLGGDLAGNLIDGLSSGLNQGEFLDNMKKWIRKMLVQSVVYTESMKAEIEAIGQAISKGISEGFTETSFHEIRRDLSWVFNQANQTIEGIDNILNSVFSGGYATGTNNATSGLHLVGEAGPELVKFRGGEQVINASNTNKALANMGRSTNNFNVTFNNLQDTTAFSMMQQLKAYNRQMAINGIM